jgi:methylphosphotriester-DNA--protein-cysteine methyltransferase
LQKLYSHHHVELELNLVVQGAITYIVNGRRATFLPRTLIWLFPHQEHQLVNRSDNMQFYCLVFKQSLISKACKTAAFEELKHLADRQEGVLSTVLRPESFDLISKIMDAMMQGSLESDLLNREVGFGPGSDFHFEHNDPDTLNAGLRYLLLLCWRSQLTGKTASDTTALHPAIRHALKLLSEEDTEKDLGELARACSVSKSYLSRTFRRQIGVPLNRYRNSLRLTRFFEEYRQQDQKNLAEAMFAAGFGSYAQFYKVFTQAYGRGPRAVLEHKLNDH